MQYELVYARSDRNKLRVIGIQIGDEFIRKKGTETEKAFLKRVGIKPDLSEQPTAH